MDKISFKLNELDDVLEENIDEFSKHLDYYDTEEDGNNSLVVRNYRIVIPDLHVSFREGDWYYRETENAVWEPQASVYVRYNENEKDINKYISFMTGSLRYSLHDLLIQIGQKDLNIDNYLCYIEFD